jgi:hypothetical protein
MTKKDVFKQEIQAYNLSSIEPEKIYMVYPDETKKSLTERGDAYDLSSIEPEKIYMGGVKKLFF